MARPSVVTLAVAFAVLLGCQQAPRNDNAQADIDAIKQIREKEIASLRDGRPDDFIAVVTSDAVFLPPDEPAVTGHEALRKWAQGMLDQFTVTGAYTGSDVIVAGDWAIERYTGTMTVTPKKGGALVEEHLRGIHIYRRQADGSWRIAQDMWNSGAPAANASR
jgi:uncharacterized protein (TIGR02246 family)